PGSDEHDATHEQQGESSNDEENSADLLDRAEDHVPLGNRLSGGEGGIRTGCSGRLATRGDEWHGVGRYSAENKDFDLKLVHIKLRLPKSLRGGHLEPKYAESSSS